MPQADAAHCRRITRAHARTFSLASSFLPAEKRRAAFAVYAFCRVADDIVDDDRASRAEAQSRLARYRGRLTMALEGAPDDGVFRELVRAVAAFGVPHAVLYELLEGVARDLVPPHYRTWTELSEYCEGVASSVGEMCAHVFGVNGDAGDRARAMRYARTMGLAMQLTNILRDVGEDARRGRCYLPDDDLARFGLSREEILGNANLGRDERWAPFVAFQIGRARSLYEAARPGLALLAPDAQRCAFACANGYASILGAIEEIRFNSVSRRASVSSLERTWLLWRTMRAPVMARLA